MLVTSTFKRRHKVSFSNWRNFSYWLVVFLSLTLAVIYAIKQYREAHYIKSVAQRVIQEAQAADDHARVIALRDFLRANVKYQEAPYDSRPFLRATAAETIQAGLGYCGEVTRAFICLADAVGIRAQRINLVGKRLHVVAEAELAPGSNVIVDCQNPPTIADLEQLDKIILRSEYDDYYTLNLRRLRLNGAVSRLKMQLGPLTYWTENPHALKAMLWFSFALALICGRGLRVLLRFGLRWRGWIHVSNEKDVRAAVAVLEQRKVVRLQERQIVIGD